MKSSSPSETECPACGSLSIGKSSLFEDKEWRIVECRDCGMNFCATVPDAESLKALYQRPSVVSTDVTVPWIRAKEAYLEALLRKVEEITGGPGTLLDLGCSTGDFMSLAQQRGWKADGIDWDAQAASIAQRRVGINVMVGNTSDVLSEVGTYDLVAMSHYLEHTANPLNEMILARAHLSSGGRLLIRAPNGGCHVARLLGCGWNWYGPPYHLNYFTEKALARLCDRSGMIVQCVNTRRGDAHMFPIELTLAAAKRVMRLRRPWFEYSAYATVQSTRIQSAFRIMDSISTFGKLFTPLEDSEIVLISRKS